MSTLVDEPGTDSRSPIPVAHAQPSRRPTGWIVVGALILLAGAGWLLDVAGIAVRWQLLVPAMLMVVGACLVAVAREGAHGGLVTLGVVLTVVLALTAVGPLRGIHLGGGVGDRSERPAAVADLPDRYEQAVGDMTVDLRSVRFPAGATRLDVELGIGNLMILVPEDVAVDLNADVSAGQIVVFGEEHDGLDVTVDDTFGTHDRVVRLSAVVGIGNLEVRR